MLILTQAGDMERFTNQFAAVRAAGLGITLHIAEVLFCLGLRDFFCSKCINQTLENTPEETLKLLSFKPDRLGHATFLNDEAQSLVDKEQIAIEICLTSNFL
jgi:adenosine deaminase